MFEDRIGPYLVKSLAKSYTRSGSKYLFEIGVELLCQPLLVGQLLTRVIVLLVLLLHVQICPLALPWEPLIREQPQENLPDDFPQSWHLKVTFARPVTSWIGQKLHGRQQLDVAPLVVPLSQRLQQLVTNCALQGLKSSEAGVEHNVRLGMNKESVSSSN